MHTRGALAARGLQAALIITYCSAQARTINITSTRPTATVRGVVRPPALELANRANFILKRIFMRFGLPKPEQSLPLIFRTSSISTSDLPVRSDVVASLTPQRAW